METGFVGADKRRALASVETPLQLLNLLALLETPSFADQFASVTLVVFKQFTITEQFKFYITESNLFKSVYYIDAYYSKYNKKHFPFISLERCLLPSQHHASFGCYLDRIPDDEYAYLLTGCASIYAMDLKQRFVRYGKTIFYEEGEGSYLGNFVKSAACYDRELLMTSKSRSRWLVGTVLNILSGGRLKFDTSELRLYKPDLVDVGIYRPSVQLASIAPLGSPSASVFRKSCPYEGERRHLSWVYLGNPDIDVSEGQATQLRDILERVASCNHELLYRKHPRSHETALPPRGGFVNDDGTQMWELMCLRGDITESTVLFGFGSTAQTNPARMFGIHPVLVFLHRFMHEGIDRTYAERALEKARVLYGEDADKILVPSNMDELDAVLANLLATAPDTCASTTDTCASTTKDGD